ncbi:hypothetical protein P5673_001992 [Acropora cervicornis]|uniref:Uncharacterized protein n=1 Tax=Acropora cervicornis TaxID=6130 RepID=A0AAD9VFW4_ACRCE|nr:hypothetical protein P5673_001992 [Acropora cervicornis]
MATELAVIKAIEIAMNALNSVNEHYYEDDIIIGWWNDWGARDQRAHIEKTFKHGRFSREKRTLGIVNGRWYCCFKQAALKAKGHPLDDEKN